ncbi:SH3 domain-containing protein [Vibrio vulnificus]
MQKPIKCSSLSEQVEGFESITLSHVCALGAAAQAATLPHASLFESAVQAATLPHASLFESAVQAATLPHASLFESAVKAATLPHSSLFESAVQAATLPHASLFESAVKAATLPHASLFGSAVKAATLPHASLFESAMQAATLPHASLFESAVKAAALSHGSVLESAIQAASFPHSSVFDTVVNSASLMRFDALSSLYTEQELTEFSEVLSEVDNNLQQESCSEIEAVKTLQKIPAFVLLFLKYLFNYIVMPLFVAAYLQPILQDYLQNNSEPPRVQKNTIKKLPQKHGIEITAANRFITGNGVRLRSSASTKVEIISYLEFGQLVYVLEKDRSWVKVAVPQKNAKPLEGWVLNEYTERFK